MIIQRIRFEPHHEIKLDLIIDILQRTGDQQRYLAQIITPFWVDGYLDSFLGDIGDSVLGLEFSFEKNVELILHILVVEGINTLILGMAIEYNKPLLYTFGAVDLVRYFRDVVDGDERRGSIRVVNRRIITGIAGIGWGIDICNITSIIAGIIIVSRLIHNIITDITDIISFITYSSITEVTIIRSI